jgi:TRAP-type uncharacterized transport system fused permease subunit
MPPIMGAAAFIMADFLQVAYTDVVIAALIPAILYYAALFIVADLEAGRRGITRIPEADIPRAWPVLKSGWIFPVPFAVLIGTLFFLNYSPELAALVSAAVILATGALIGYRGRRLPQHRPRRARHLHDRRRRGAGDRGPQRLGARLRPHARAGQAGWR